LYPDAPSKFLVQRDQQNDARNQDNKRDKKMAVRENGFRSVGKSQLNLQERSFWRRARALWSEDQRVFH